MQKPVKFFNFFSFVEIKISKSFAAEFSGIYFNVNNLLGKLSSLSHS
jgi:hypothetical protein